MAAAEIADAMIDLRYKTFWRRVGAGFVDALVFAPLTALMFWVYAKVDHGVALALIYVVQQVAGYTYSVGMHARYGQTLGKMASGIKVIDVSEARPISLRQALRRDSVWIAFSIVATLLELSRLLDGIGPLDRTQTSLSTTLAEQASFFWFLAEVVTMLFNAKRRSLHDFIAGTVVVRIAPRSRAEARAA